MKRATSLRSRAKATKPKVCANCGATYTPRPGAQSFEKWCTYECGVVLSRVLQTAKLKRERLTREKEEDLAWATRKAALGPSKKELNLKIASAEKSVRLYCRVRDYWDGCISCGASKTEVESRPDNGGGHWDGGHFIPKGAKASIRFNTWNIHKQCKLCNGGENRYRHGGKSESVKAGYDAGLTNKIGADRVAWLRGPHPILQPNIEYCNRVIRIFNKRAKHVMRFRAGKGWC